jgi:hypothetical protein
MSPHGAAPRRRAVDREGAPDREAADASQQCPWTIRLDDEMQMVCLNGEVQHAKGALRLDARIASRTRANMRSVRKDGTDGRARNVTWTG